MARVNVLREVRSGDIGEWQLCLHWCRYWMDDDGILYGYRFVWRRAEDGSIQAARGQARIPNLDQARDLMERACKAGWGDRDAVKMEAAASRLEQAGCVVDMDSGHVRWPDKESAIKGLLTEEMIADGNLLQAWAH